MMTLSYLNRLPINKLKIDQSFIRDNPESNDNTLVQAIIAMDNSLKLKLIAEGVKSAQHVEFLKQHHRQYAQGFYYVRPVPAERIESLFSSTARPGTSGKLVHLPGGQ